MTGDTPNGRVTLRDTYEMLERRDIRLNERIDQIMERLEPLPGICKQIEVNTANIKDNKDEIKYINRRSNWWDGINSALVLIAGYLGFK